MMSGPLLVVVSLLFGIYNGHSLYYSQYHTIIPLVFSFETEVSFTFPYIQCPVANHHLELCHTSHILEPVQEHFLNLRYQPNEYFVQTLFGMKN